MITNLKKNRLYFISEIGMNYNGNIDLCYELIKQSKYSGADFVKFQLGWRDKSGEINQLDHEKIKKLIKIAKYFDITIFFSIISEKAFSISSKYNFKFLKIASRTLKYDLPLAEKIVKTKKNIIASLGMWKKSSPPFKPNNKIFYLWCISEYPTYPWKIKNFPKNFKKTIFSGYSDHTVGIDMPIIAISRGAHIIEKHFTLDKSDTTIRDHALSSDPKEFTNMVQVGHEIFKKIQLEI